MNKIMKTRNDLDYANSQPNENELEKQLEWFNNFVDYVENIDSNLYNQACEYSDNIENN
tara:strand:- start:54 stop:230 length:177 start_codon:yes stop_codon:yes gene_type:complete